MKIGLYTLHTAHNVGAMLQTFATVKILKKEGHVVEVVNVFTEEQYLRNHHKAKTSLLRNFLRKIFIRLHPGIKKMEQHFDDFHNQLPLTKRYYTNQEYMNAPNDYDLHLIGSDQVWNVQNGIKSAELFFLKYLPQDAVKKSYAASFGTTDILKDLKLVKDALDSFECISVREDKAVNLVERLTGKKCAQVLDPTLLMSSKDWDLYIEEKPYVEGNYIFYYGVNDDDNTWNILCYAKKILNAKILGYPGPLPPKYHFDKYIYDGGPLEFINLIKNASLVITASFHGLAFSINYNKKFILVRYGNRMGRMESLIRLLGAGDFIAASPEDVDKIIELNDNVSKMNSIQEKLETERNLSLEWIKNNLSSVK